MSTATTQQAIPKLFPKMLHGWVGNGRMFPFLARYEKNPAVAYLNSIYNTAPLFKWSLSIVPLYGIFIGNPPAEKIDFKSSAALTVSGVIWFAYALLIQPQNAGSRSLALVNICLASVNGFNCYRSVQYQRTKDGAMKSIQ